MGLCLGGIAAVAPFAYRLMPERTKKSVLTEADMEALDARVKLYQRMQTVEDNQKHHSEGLRTLQSDFNTTSSLLFQKIDGIKDILIKDRSE